MLGAAVIVGVTPIEAKEIVYQAVPHVGMAKVYDFLHATNEVLSERGIKLALPGQSSTSPETRASKGREVQARIIGTDRVEKLYASAPEDQMHVQRFLSANFFGDYVARGGINMPTRELLTLSSQLIRKAMKAPLTPDWTRCFARSMAKVQDGPQIPPFHGIACAGCVLHHLDALSIRREREGYRRTNPAATLAAIFLVELDSK